MQIYTDLESMIADGIIQGRANPNCVEIMQQQFVEYIVGQSLTCDYPVLEIYSNPRKAMQGGFISAAFDNTFGLLVYLATNRLDMATIDMDVNYHRPIFENDKLTVTVYIRSLGKTIIHLIGEAFNSDKQIIASATTNVTLLNDKSE